jgi:hypothetical protein
MFASVGYAPGGAVIARRGGGRRKQLRGEDKVTSFSSNFFQKQTPRSRRSSAVAHAHDVSITTRALLGNGGGVHRRRVACAAEGGGGGGKPSGSGAAGDALAGRMAKAKKYKEAAGTGTDGYAKATAAAEVDINLARVAEGGGGGDKPSGGGGGGGGGAPSAKDALAERMAKAKKYKEAAGTDGYAKAVASSEVEANLARARAYKVGSPCTAVDTSGPIALESTPGLVTQPLNL